MQYAKNTKQSFLQEILDVSFLFIFFFLFLRLQYQYFWTEEYPLEKLPTYIELFESHYKALFLFVVFWIIISKNLSLYALFRTTKFVEILKKLVYQLLIFSVVVFSISGFKTSDLLSPQLGICYLISLFIACFLSRYIRFNYYKNLHENEQDICKILIIDENDNTNKFVDILNERKDLGLRLGTIVYNENILENNSQILINGEEFLDYLKARNIDWVYISQKGKISAELLNKIKNICETGLLPISFIPDSIYNGITQLKLEYVDTLPILQIKRFPLDLKYNQIYKRTFDIVLAVLVFVLVLSWLFPIIAILIYFDSKGPIIFKQKRNGLNGQEFFCYKFRTMVESKDNSIKATERNDPRITRLGRILRKSSIDELPQFFNVLKGDMSIVGPRPHMISQDHYYKQIISKYNIRHYVKPGITGLSQVKGYRGAIDCDEDMEKRIRTDIYYVRNWSYFLDIQIIYLTILLIIRGDDNAI